MTVVVHFSTDGGATWRSMRVVRIPNIGETVIDEDPEHGRVYYSVADVKFIIGEEGRVELSLEREG